MDLEKNISYLSVRRDTVNGMQAVKLIGPFDSLSDLVLEYARQIYSEGNREIVLDLNDVTFMTSQGIACIIKILKLVRNDACRLYLYGASKDMVDMVRLARIEQYLTVI